MAEDSSVTPKPKPSFELSWPRLACMLGVFLVPSLVALAYVVIANEHVWMVYLFYVTVPLALLFSCSISTLFLLMFPFRRQLLLPTLAGYAALLVFFEPIISGLMWLFQIELTPPAWKG